MSVGPNRRSGVFGGGRGFDDCGSGVCAHDCEANIRATTAAAAIWRDNFISNLLQMWRDRQRGDRQFRNLQGSLRFVGPGTTLTATVGGAANKRCSFGLGAIDLHV